MGQPIVETREFFSKVKAARELLRQQSEQLLREYLDIIQQAKVDGDYETAAKHMQWLIAHMPKEAGDPAIVDRSVDATHQPDDNKSSGPSIQIGIVMGGVKPQISTGTPVKAIEGEIEDP